MSDASSSSSDTSVTESGTETTDTSKEEAKSAEKSTGSEKENESNSKPSSSSSDESNDEKEENQESSDAEEKPSPPSEAISPEETEKQESGIKADEQADKTEESSKNAKESEELKEDTTNQIPSSEKNQNDTNVGQPTEKTEENEKQEQKQDDVATEAPKSDINTKEPSEPPKDEEKERPSGEEKESSSNSESSSSKESSSSTKSSNESDSEKSTSSSESEEKSAAQPSDSDDEEKDRKPAFSNVVPPEKQVQLEKPSDTVASSSSFDVPIPTSPKSMNNLLLTEERRFQCRSSEDERSFAAEAAQFKTSNANWRKPGEQIDASLKQFTTVRLAPTSLTQSSFQPEPIPEDPEDPEEAIELKHKAVVEADKKISEWYQNKDNIPEQLWSQSFIDDIIDIENPFSDPDSKEFVQKYGENKSAMADILSLKTKKLNLNHPVESDMAATPQRNLIYESELSHFDDPQSVMNQEIEFSTLGSFIKSTKLPDVQFPMLNVKQPEPYPNDYLTFQLDDFKHKVDPLQPIVCSAFIYLHVAGKHEPKFVISQEWRFAPEFSSTMFSEVNKTIKNNLKAAFEFQENNQENAYLIITFSQPLTVDGCAPINKYYLNSTPANKHKADDNKKNTWPRNKDIMTTIGWNYIKISEIVDEQSKFDLPVFIYDQPIVLCNIPEMLEAAKKNKFKSYPFSVEISAGKKKAPNDHALIADGFQVIRKSKVTKPTETPVTQFYHQIQIQINEALFTFPDKKGGRNIFAKLMLKESPNASEPLKLLRNQLNNEELTSYGFTKCWYHQKKPFFEEQFTFDLPYPLPKELCLHVEFYHAIAQKSDDESRKVGDAFLSISNGEMLFKDKVYILPVVYDGKYKKPIPEKNENFVGIRMKHDSVVVSTDENLTNFYLSKGEKVELIPKIPDVLLFKYFYPITDILAKLFEISGVKAFNGFHYLVAALGMKVGIFRDLLNNYAFYLSCREPKPSLHRHILHTYGKFLHECVQQNSNDTSDLYLIDFFFYICIKSIVLTKDRRFTEQYENFVNNFAKRVLIVNPELLKYYLDSFAVFMNLLFDTKHYTFAFSGFNALVSSLLKAKQDILERFLNNCLQPKFFYTGIMKSPSFKKIIGKLAKHGLLTIPYVFPAFMRSIKPLDHIRQEIIAGEMLSILSQMNPLKHNPNNDELTTKSMIMFYSFIISHIKFSEQFKIWWDDLQKSNVFDSLHYMIDTIKYSGTEKPPEEITFNPEKELAYSIHNGIIHFVNLVKDDLTVTSDISTIIYHLICSNICMDLYPSLINLLIYFIEADIEFSYINFKPVFAKFLMKLFEKTSITDYLEKLIIAAYKSEQKSFNNSILTDAYVARSIFLLPKEKVILIKLNSSEPVIVNIRNMIAKSIEIDEELEKTDLMLERQGWLIYERALLFKASPDSLYESLIQLAKFHEEKQYWEEALQVYLSLVAISLEYMTLQKRIPDIYNNIHAAHALDNVCSYVPKLVFPEDNCPMMDGYCDSPGFSLMSLTMLINKINHFIEEKNLYEIGYLLVDFKWPFYESHSYYPTLKKTFEKEATMIYNFSLLPPDDDRMFGHYFRIKFYGKCFEEDNGRTYIYREKELTHLYELSDRLKSQYGALYNKPIEIIKESADVTISEEDLETKGSLQITFVEPFFPKSEACLHATQYERYHMINCFFFDSPFTKGNKAQGTVDQQWLLRTLLYVELPMPGIIKRQIVLPENIKKKEFEPIRVSYRQLKERIGMMEIAVEAKDNRQIQQLLHGSLLVQVNEGPSRMAEVFLADDADHPQKYKDKLRNAFKSFLKINEEGLTIHGDWVSRNPAFLPLQSELESGYTALADKLKKYIGEVSNDEEKL